MSALIFQQIPKVMGEIEAISKNRDNKSQGFKFRGIDDVINEVSARLAKHRLFVVPEVLDERREQRETKSGGISSYVILKIKYTLFAEDGSNISATMIGEGADSGDKASNKAQSIALKYFFLQVFAIPTEDAKDPDAESHEFKPREKPDSIPKSLVSEPKQSIRGTVTGGHIINFGTKEKGYLGMTIAQAVERDGLPRVQEYLAKIIESAEKENRPVSGKWIETRDRLREYSSELARPVIKGELFPSDLTDEEEMKIERLIESESMGKGFVDDSAYESSRLKITRVQS